MSNQLYRLKYLLLSIYAASAHAVPGNNNAGGIQQCNTDLGICQTTNTQLQGSLTTCQTDNSLLQSSLTSCQTTNTQLQNSNTQLQATNTQLQNSNTQLQSSNTQLQATNTQLQTSNTQLQTSLNSCQTTNAQLQGSLNTCQTTNTQLQSSNTQLQTSNSQLQSTNTQLQTSLNSCQTNSTQLQTSLNNCQISNTQLQSSSTQTQTLLNSCQTSLSSCQSAASSGTLYSQVFTNNGTFTVPAGVTSITVSLAGGAGGSIKYVHGRYYAYGGRGGMRSNIPLTVTPGASYNVYIGKKGEGPLAPNGLARGGDGCSGGGVGYPGNPGGINGGDGVSIINGVVNEVYANYAGIGSHAGPANGSFDASSITYAWVNGSNQKAKLPGGIGNAGGYSGSSSSYNTSSGGGSTCFGQVVACGGGAGSTVLSENDGSNTLWINGGDGACAGDAAGTDDFGGWDSDGYVAVQWRQ